MALDTVDVRFRGKPIHDLTREELIAALMQALNQLHQREGYSAVGGIEMPQGRVVFWERPHDPS